MTVAVESGWLCVLCAVLQPLWLSYESLHQACSVEIGSVRFAKSVSDCEPDLFIEGQSSQSEWAWWARLALQDVHLFDTSFKEVAGLFLVLPY